MTSILTLKFKLPTPHNAQKEVLRSDARFVVVACGRRFGKTTLGQRAILRHALMHHKACWWLAPTYGMAAQVWRDLKAACAQVKNIYISETERRIDFLNGGYIAIRSTHHPDNLRGAGLDFVVLDEAAYMDATVWPEVVRPMLLERRGHALFLSSPNGLNWFHDIYQLGLHPSPASSFAPAPATEGSFPSLPSGEGLGVGMSAPPLHPSPASSLAPAPATEVSFPSLPSGEGLGVGMSAPPLHPSPSSSCAPETEASFPSLPSGEGLGVGMSSLTQPSVLSPQSYKEDRRTWRSFTFPSSANPLIDPAELDIIRAQTTERVWRQEYLAEFTASIGQVFRGIREVATAPLGVSPIPGVRYICGLDWGRDNDATVIVIFRADTRQMVALDRFNQVSWSLQRGRLKQLYDRWQPAAIWAESNSIGSPNIEALQAEGLPIRPFYTTTRSKSPLIENLALAIERRDLALLPDETLLSELAAYTMQRSAAGNYLYAAPSGQHDDCVIATALAWHGLRFNAPSISFA